MLAKIGVSIVIVLTILLNIGCSGEGVFENPDSIRVTTLEAIHGKRGHLVTIEISKNADGMTKQAVLEIQDPEVTDAVLYVVVKSGNSGIGGMIDLLKNATEVAIVSDMPKDTKPWTRLVLTLGGEGGNPFAGYLKVDGPTGTEYLSLRGTVTQERIAWFLTEVSKPPKVIDTMPPTVIEISYYRDLNLTKPLTDVVMVGDTIYTKVVLSKEVPIVIADDESALPNISFSGVGSGPLQCRMKPWDIRDEQFQSGDAKPHPNGKNTFICKYVVQTKDTGRSFFAYYVGHRSTSGNPLRIIFYVHTNESATINTITDWQPSDFVGQVFTPVLVKDGSIRSGAQPITNVTVTIMAGPRSGESTLTDKNGRYLFPNIQTNELHLLVEKERFESKEAVVHRSRPTILSNGNTPNYEGDPQKKPGNILIGQKWPDEIRFILEETLIVYDLLYLEGGTPLPGEDVGGFYGPGIVVVYSNQYADRQDSVGTLGTFAHEIAHAHQHALVSIDGSPSKFWLEWQNTPEGRAFSEAREKDRKEVGNAKYDLIPGYSSLFENAAETCAHYWSVNRWGGRTAYGKLEETAPNRFKWAEEWLKKK